MPLGKNYQDCGSPPFFSPKRRIQAASFGIGYLRYEYLEKNGSDPNSQNVGIGGRHQPWLHCITRVSSASKITRQWRLVWDGTKQATAEEGLLVLRTQTRPSFDGRLITLRACPFPPWLFRTSKCMLVSLRAGRRRRRRI